MVKSVEELAVKGDHGIKNESDNQENYKLEKHFPTFIVAYSKIKNKSGNFKSSLNKTLTNIKEIHDYDMDDKTPKKRKRYPMAYVYGISSGLTGAPGWILTYVVLKGTYSGVVKPVFKISKNLVKKNFFD